MQPLKMVIPKGRIYNKVTQLLEEMGIRLIGSDRSYRPKVLDSALEVKLLKSQNISPLLALGQHDIGFSGWDWVLEQKADVEDLLDLGFDPVSIVAAIPDHWQWQEVKSRPLIAVSEYKQIATQYLDQQNIEYTFIRSSGATEVFPPEDADLVIDNCSSGSTLAANHLKIVDTIMTSTTHFIANKNALEDANKKAMIDDLLLLMKAVLAGRARVLLEMNCSEEQVDHIVELLPAMRAPTVAKLYRSSAFSVKAAVKQVETKSLIPKLIQAGATDILELPIRKVL